MFSKHNKALKTLKMSRKYINYNYYYSDLK